VNDGGLSTVGTLFPLLKAQGHNPRFFAYGWVGLIGAWLGNGKRAKKLKNCTSDNDVLIGHSNGCAIIARALKKGANPKRIIFIHPALNKLWEPPDSFEGIIHVYHSERDRATEVAKLTKWVPKSIWGDMGGSGAVSGHPAFINHDDGFRHSEGFEKNPELYLETL